MMRPALPEVLQPAAAHVTGAVMVAWGERQMYRQTGRQKCSVLTDSNDGCLSTNSGAEDSKKGKIEGDMTGAALQTAPSDKGYDHGGCFWKLWGKGASELVTSRAGQGTYLTIG